MLLEDVISEIDAQIEKLNTAKSALQSLTNDAPTLELQPVKRQLSPAARKRIADAQKARWAKQKEGAG